MKQVKSWLLVRAAMTAVAFFGAAVGINAEDKFYLPDFDIEAGETKELAIQFESDNVSLDDPYQLEYVGFQFDIYLPEGLTIVKKKGKYNFTFNQDRYDDHTFTTADQDDGAIRVLSASLSNSYFWETEGDFIFFSVTASADFTGEQQIVMKDIMFSTKEGNRTELADVVTTINRSATLVINDADGIDFAPEGERSYESVVYNREVEAGKYYSTMLPFAPDANTLANYEFYELSGSSDDCLYFSLVDAPQANIPYLYGMKEGVTEVVPLTAGETTVGATVEQTVSNDWHMVGSFVNKTVDCTVDDYSNYVYNTADNVLNRVTQTLTVKPFRAYIRKSGVVNVATMRLFIETPKGLKEITRDVVTPENEEGIYDLQGRPVQNPVKGQIYIVNGEKSVY